MFQRFDLRTHRLDSEALAPPSILNGVVEAFEWGTRSQSCRKRLLARLSVIATFDELGQFLKLLEHACLQCHGVFCRANNTHTIPLFSI